MHAKHIRETSPGQEKVARTWQEPISALDISTFINISRWRTEDISPGLRADVLARYPRLGLGEEFIGYFEDQAKRKPLCLAAKFVRSGLAARVAANPLDREARRGQP